MKFNVNAKKFYFAIETITKYWLYEDRLSLSDLINIKLNNNSLIVANTDGYKLFCEKFNIDFVCDNEIEYTIKIDKDKIKKIKSKKENMEIEIKENFISINNIDFEIKSFRYPEYQSLLKPFNENATIIKIKKEEIINALDTIKEVSINKINAIKLEVTKNSLRFYKDTDMFLNYEFFANDYEIISIIDNKDIDRIYLNSEYLSIILKSFLEEYIYIDFTGHLCPVYLAGIMDNLKKRESLRMLMPLRG